MKIVLIVFICLYGLWITLRNIANIVVLIRYSKKEYDLEELKLNLRHRIHKLSFEEQCRYNIEKTAQYFFINVGVFVTGLYFAINL